MEQILFFLNNTTENYPTLLRLFFFLPAYIAFAKQNIASHFFLIAGIIAMFLPSYFMYLTPIFFGFLLISFTLSAPIYNGIKYRDFGFVKTWIIHPMEGFFGYLFFAIVKLIPIRLASFLGANMGQVVRLFAPKRHQLALKNLKIAFPKMKQEERDKIAKDMWSNFGRMIFEIPHLKFFYKNDKYLKLEGEKHLSNLPNHRFVAIFGHFNSIGLISLPFSKRKFPCSVIYRFPNNPVAVDLLQQAFGKGMGDLEFFPKSRYGIKQALDFLKQGLPVAIAPDQYFTRGKPLTFFGKTAMTSTVAVKMANHFDCPILPIQIIREKGIKHKIVIHKPIYFKGVSEKEINANMQKVNDFIEDWVRQNPSQWLWVHHRWGKKA